VAVDSTALPVATIRGGGDGNDGGPVVLGLSEPKGGEEFAYALLAASCTADVSTEHVYLALITPSDEPDEDGEA